MREYDYVIVGAGSAGCVLAGRLSEKPDVSVALLEAGGSARSLGVRIPAAFPKLFGTDRDWQYYSDPEPGLNDRK
nr:GMC family oxidoreductase N-terminal domain-containing protein [Candidatus Nanopelagicales bacterium]